MYTHVYNEAITKTCVSSALSIFLSIYVSICLAFYLSVYLSIYVLCESKGESHSGGTFRLHDCGNWFVNVLLVRLLNEIEQPSFRVDTLTTQTFRKVFRSCSENPGLADFLRHFIDNMNCEYVLEAELDNQKKEFHYITRWFLGKVPDFFA